MEAPAFTLAPKETESLVVGVEEATKLNRGDEKEKEEDDKEGEKYGKGLTFLLTSPARWFRMLAVRIHWSFVVGVVFVYGMNQGVGGSLGRVATDYYWKDVQKVQPSEAQVYQGITYIPWIVKPIWGLFTDVLPISGYKRRPYFILAGLLGMMSMLIVSLHKNLHILLALLLLTGSSTGSAISDVTIDACVAENSKNIPSLAADMQSLCGLSSSIGALLGFSISGLLVDLVGSQGALGLICFPAALVFSVGLLLKETPDPSFAYSQIHQKLREAAEKMLITIKCREVWRPCLYMYASFALSFNIHEGMFYWYTHPKAGPNFSQEAIGFIFSVGSVGALLGVLLFQNFLKDYPFRNLLFWTQLFYGFSGMLDLILVLRLNLMVGMPDYFFAVVDECVSQMTGRLKWLPLLVLTSKLCPSGIEGTFFALLMSIDNAGVLTSSWLGGLLLHVLKVTRTKFGNLWIAILVRNIMRLVPLVLLFLVPTTDPSSHILPLDILAPSDSDVAVQSHKNTELMSLVEHAQ